MLHRIRDEIGLLVIRLSIEHNALSGILWNILLYWILVSIVIVAIVLNKSLSSRPVICSVRWHPLNSLLVKKSHTSSRMANNYQILTFGALHYYHKIESYSST
jgi:hypothetical protein